MNGLAIECSGERIAVAVFDAQGETRGLRARLSAHAHARNLLGLVEEALAEAGLAVRDLDGVAVDVGPGSFTALRVGLATARGLTQPFARSLVGVTSFAALALGKRAPRRLVVPLLPAGREQYFAGFHRGDSTGELAILRGPAAGTIDGLSHNVDEALALCARGTLPWFIGPGAVRARLALEDRYPGSTLAPGAVEGSPVADAEGPSAEAVARLGARQLAGMAAVGAAASVAGGANGADRAAADLASVRPLYVRAPQAVERAQGPRPFTRELAYAPLTDADLDDVLPIEVAVFTDPWPRQFFLDEMRVPQAVTCVTRHRGRLAGYLLAWRIDAEVHLGNLAVAPEFQRKGVGQALLDWLSADARAHGALRITLEVRSTNFAAQELYRRDGYKAVAIRRGYYQDTGEDALVMLRDLSAP
jgi:ribosomal-protein-alanine N-acetyltransferase